MEIGGTMATIQVPYGIRLPEDENLQNTNRLLRGVVGGIGAVTGAYRAQKEQAAQAIQGHDEREFAQRLTGGGGVTPSESRFVPSVNAGVQPTETTQPKANWWDKSQLKEEVPMAQQSAKRPIHEVYKTPREALMAMPDSMFKAFADEHKHIPGLGYAENIETGKMERLIPQSRQQTNGGVDISKLDESQLNAYANYMRAKTDEKTGVPAEAHIGLEREKIKQTAESNRLTREENIAYKRDALNAKVEEAETKSKEGRIKSFMDNEIAPFAEEYEDPKTFEKKKDYGRAFTQKAVTDFGSIPENFKPQANFYKSKYDKWVSSFMEANKGKWKDTPEARMGLLELYLDNKLYSK